MVNKELIRQLLKELEAEKGCPIQLRADTPQSERYCNDSIIDGREYFGQFEKREVIVRRVSSLDPKYEHDVSLIEGEYPSLSDLQKKIKEHDLLYGQPFPSDTPAGRAFDLVQKATKKKLLINYLACNFEDKHGISQKEAERILQENGITAYFNHRIIARPDGVYDDKTDDSPIVDETKVADITLKLIE